MKRWLLLLLALFPAAAGAQDILLPNKSGSVRFAAIGDNGTGDGREYETGKMLVAVRAKFSFDFVIMLGDNMYGGESERDFRRKFEAPYKALLESGVKFYASLGNHDNTTQRFYKLYNMGGKRFYAYTKGNVRFFALDSNYMDKEQLQWIEQQLSGAGAAWKICYFHHPLYSSGRTHGSDLALRAVLEPLFVKYGVNAVFSGHDHTYERIKPQKGVSYFVCGSSGQLRRSNVRPGSDLTAKAFDDDNAFMLVEVSGETLSFQAISRTGRTVDTGKIDRTGAAGAKTAASAP